MPVNVVAVDLKESKEIVFESGDPLPIILGSAAFPGIYKPIIINNQMIADGGITDNVPADICRKFIGKENIVISIMLSGPFDSAPESMKSAFQIIWRSIYIPIIQNRIKIAEENSDLVLRPLSHLPFSFKSWKSILKFHNVKKMEGFYYRGVKEARKNMPLIKKLINN